MTGTAPGWYPDPSRPGSMRWWDGTQWSEHSAPAAPAAVYVGGTDGMAIASLVIGSIQLVVLVGVLIAVVALGGSSSSY